MGSAGRPASSTFNFPEIGIFIFHQNRLGGQHILIAQFRNISADEKILTLFRTKA